MAHSVRVAHQVSVMKKTAKRNLPTKAKTPKTVDEYLATVPEPARSTLKKVRATIRAAVPPEATETISYGIPAFKYKGMLVWYAGFKDHCSLFPGASLIAAFKDDLKKFHTTKGTIHFRIDKPLSATLLKKLLRARIAENERKKPR